MPHIDTGTKWKKHFLFTNWFAFKCVQRMSKSLPLIQEIQELSSSHSSQSCSVFFWKGKVEAEERWFIPRGSWVAGRKTAAYRYGFGQSKQAASVLLLTESEWVKHEQIILNLLVINQLI